MARENEEDDLDLEFDLDFDVDELDIERPTLESSRFDGGDVDVADFDFDLFNEDGTQLQDPEADEVSFDGDGEEDRRLSYEDDPAQDYWARELDEDMLVSKLETKVEEFRNYQRSSAYWRWLIKNWQYSHNLYFDDQIDSIGVSALGEQGELVGYAVNHFRNLLQQLLTLVTRDRPALIVRAKNSDARSIIQSRLGKSLVESYFRDKNGEKYLKRAVEDALVFAQGYVELTWNPQIGEEIDGNVDDGSLTYEGDVMFANPTAWDVFYDLGQVDWDQQSYTIVRKPVNMWDLIVQHPEKREEILAAQKFPDSYDDTNRPLLLENDIYQESDMIEVFFFYHKKSDALPNGRLVKYIPGALLLDTDLPYQGIPLWRVVPGELLLSPFGYTPAFDLQAPQEILNQEASAIATNHKSFAIQNVWTQTGDNVTQKELEGGLNHVQSDQPPQPLNLTSTPPEVFQFLAHTIQDMEYLSGINSVARGQPEASLKSGSALALIDAKAVQFATPLIHSYHQLLEGIGTAILHLLRDFAQTERVISVVGIQNATHLKKFKAEDLSEIDRVIVESVNPVLNTFAGRVEMADKLLQGGLINVPEEYLNVLQTGQVESLLEAENAQLAKVRDESENLLQGGAAYASPYDNHVLHIKEHHAILNSVEASLDNELVSVVAAHISEHVLLLQDAEIQKVLMVLGYPIPLPPTHVGDMPLPPQQGAPGQAPAPGAPGAPKGPTPEGPLGAMAGMPPTGIPGVDGRSTPRMPQMPNLRLPAAIGPNISQ